MLAGGGAESAGATGDPGSAGACDGPAAGSGAGAPAPGAPPSPASTLMRRTVSWPGAGEAQGASRRTGRAVESDGTTRAERTARASILSVVVTGLGTYRRSFWRIVIAAVLVFAPIDFIVTLATVAATDYAERSDVLSVFLWTSGTALGVAGTVLSLVFFAGVIDRIVAIDQKGEEDLPSARPPGSPDPAADPRERPVGGAHGRGPAAVPHPRLRPHGPLRRRGPRDRDRGTRSLGRPRALGRPHVTPRLLVIVTVLSRRRSTSSCPPGSSTSSGTRILGSTCPWTSAQRSSSAAWSACWR